MTDKRDQPRNNRESCPNYTFIIKKGNSTKKDICRFRNLFLQFNFYLIRHFQCLLYPFLLFDLPRTLDHHYLLVR